MRLTICSSLLVLALVTAAGTACRSNNTKKERLFEQGNAHSLKGEYREAIIQYRRAIQLDQNFGEARYRLSDAYQQVGDLPQALREATRAADLISDNNDAHLRAGRLLAMAGQFEDATTRARNVLERDPKNLEALILLGNASAGLKDSDKATATLESAAALLPGEPRLQEALGALQARRGNKEAAETALKRAIEIAPESVEPRQALAAYYRSVGRPADSERHLKEALPLDASGFVVARDLATFYFMEGRDTEAETYLVKVLAQQPKDVPLRVALGDLYTRERRFDDALRVYEPLTKEQATFATSSARMAYAEYSADRKEAAYGRIDGALAKVPKDSDLLTVKARVLLSDKKLQEAETAARAALAATPDRFQPLNTLGSALVEQGKTDEALTVLQQAARVAPGQPGPRIQLGRIYLNRGDSTNALLHARDAVRLGPEQPIARLLLVRVLIAQRDAAGAAKELALLIQRIPNSPEVQAAAGDVASLKGNRNAALQAYGRALNMSRSSAEALSGLTALQLSAGKKDEALAVTEKSVKANPGDLRILMLAARTYVAAQDFTHAEAALQQAIKISPSASLEAYSMLAGLYFTQHRLDEAKARFETLAKQQPAAIGPPTMLGIILQLQGKPKDAQMAYERLLQTKPNAAVAANNLAMLLLESGENLDVALGHAQAAKKSLPDDPSISDTLGLVYYKKGLASLAATAFEQSTQSQPANPEFWLHLGQAYAAAGNKVKARDALQRALKLDPKFGGAPIAVKALEDLNKRV